MVQIEVIKILRKLKTDSFPRNKTIIIVFSLKIVKFFLRAMASTFTLALARLRLHPHFVQRANIAEIKTIRN